MFTNTPRPIIYYNKFSTIWNLVMNSWKEKKLNQKIFVYDHPYIDAILFHSLQYNQIFTKLFNLFQLSSSVKILRLAVKIVSNIYIWSAISKIIPKHHTHMIHQPAWGKMSCSYEIDIITLICWQPRS